MDNYPPGNNQNSNIPESGPSFPAPVNYPTSNQYTPPSGMATPQATAPAVAEPPTTKKQGKGILAGLGCVGCGVIGCIGGIILILVITVGGFMWFATSLISYEPIDIPPTILTTQEQKILAEKLKQYQELENNDSTGSVKLTLTDKEINYMFQESENKDFVLNTEIQPNNKVVIQGSMKSPQTDNSTSATYVNFLGSGSIAVNQGKYTIKMSQLRIGKFNFPEGPILQGYSEAFSENMTTNPEYQVLPFNIDNLEVKDGAFHLELSKKKISSIPVPIPASTDDDTLKDF